MVEPGSVSPDVMPSTDFPVEQRRALSLAEGTGALGSVWSSRARSWWPEQLGRC